ncbi:hypothetical protein V6N13_078275 [Hibiscus sabdariffa]
MNPAEWLRRILLLSLLFHISFSADTITLDHFLKDNGDVIVSSGKNFALGFFSPGSSRNRYVGIWYYQIPGKILVWVANRNNPIKDNSGILSIDSGGNLALFQRNQTLPVWSTDISMAGTRNSVAQILDSGNLVLLQNDARKAVLWQSFDYPTNTWLSFIKLGLNKRTGLNRVFTSWKSPDDPGFGNYTLKMNTSGFPQMILYKGSTPWWRSGPWTGQRWSGIPEMTNHFILDDYFVDSADEVTFTSVVKNDSIISRTVTNETGILQGFVWNKEAQRWILFYSTPKEQCDFYGHCGPNGYCNSDLADGFECTCFPGFEPKSPQAWSIRDGTGGCVTQRGTSMCGNDEGFVKVPHVKVPDTSAAHVDMNIGLKQCKEKCLRDCSCMAYASAYHETNGGLGCLTWHGDLVDARTYTHTGQDLYIRVDANELARYTKKGLLRKKRVLAVIVVSSTVLFLIIVVFLPCLVRRQRRARTRKGKNMFSFTTFEDSLGEKEIDKSRRNGDLPFFDLSAIAAATNNFSPDNKLGQGGFGPVYKEPFVGIWYYQIPEKIIVLVANIDNPIIDNSRILRTDSLGNLACSRETKHFLYVVWSTSISITGTRNSIAQILESANLVLLHNGTRKAVLWQSFDYPTNTWLSLMSLGLKVRTSLNHASTSWKSPVDPGVGDHSFEVSPTGFPQMFLCKGSSPLWRSRTWTRYSWSGIP